jgi:Bacterial Ig-like domain (group 3)
LAGADRGVEPGGTPLAVDGLVVQDLAHGTSAQQMAQSLVGSGVTISNVTYTGTNNSGGVFTDTGPGSVLGLSDGIVLGSGSVQTTASAKGVEGPNQSAHNTTINFSPGDADLNTLSGKTTFDAAVLQFDFVPQFSTVRFTYVFSSDEYNEFANTFYNDTFGFLINGQNCALVPGTSTPVGVNTINGGNPLGTNAQNPNLFRNNDLNDGGSINTEMDGLTVPLTCNATVNAGVTNHMKLAIADATDTLYDSNVFIEAGSLVSSTQIATSLTVSPATGDFADATTVSAVLTKASDSSPVAGKSVTLTLNGAENCTATTDATGKASCPITPGEAAGTYTLAASFAGDSDFLAGNGSASFVVTHEETALSYTGETSAINGQPMTLSGQLTTDDPAAGTPLGGKLITFTLGSGAAAQTCTGTTSASGTASCSIASVAQTAGSVAAAASFAGDSFYLPASASSSVEVVAPTGAGAFVIADNSAGSPTAGRAVYFWGSQWWKSNSLSGGPAPSAMKGFADSPAAITCGSTWTTHPADGSSPPASIPNRIAVIVSNDISKSGSTISGTIVHIVTVEVAPGYSPAPGHVGTGTIVSTLC